jgi:hypothetical protein
MSSAAKSAVATVPLERSIEVLERRLIELRADIDAILTQLASDKLATSAIELAGTPEPQAPEAIAATAQPSPDLPTQDEITPEPSLSSDEMDQLANAAQMDATPVQPSAVAPSPETVPETELPSTDTGASDDLTPVASIDANLVGRLNALDTQLHAAAAPMAETPALQAEMQVEPAGEASAMPIAAAASLEPTSAEATAVAAAESAAHSVAASTAASDVPAETPVISLQARQRKQKAGFSAGASAPIRPGRRLATKIAASIVALLAAATMLVVADKAALGGAQSLPWMSPLPSYVPSSGASWPFLGLRQAASQGPTVADSGASPDPAVANDALLLRYREVWPAGW